MQQQSKLDPVQSKMKLSDLLFSRNVSLKAEKRLLASSLKHTDDAIQQLSQRLDRLEAAKAADVSMLKSAIADVSMLKAVSASDISILLKAIKESEERFEKKLERAECHIRRKHAGMEAEIVALQEFSSEQLEDKNRLLSRRLDALEVGKQDTDMICLHTMARMDQIEAGIRIIQEKIGSIQRLRQGHSANARS